MVDRKPSVVEPTERICDSILDTIGNTPLVRLSRLVEASDVQVEILAKLEFFNPLASVKDRIGLAMVEHLERKGRINPGTVIVEPTSGNTGVALAFVAAAKGYRLILTMPGCPLNADGCFVSWRKSGTHTRRSRNAGHVERAEELVRELPDAVMPQQFDNPANPEVHRRTTAEEIWADTGGRVDALVTSVGTGHVDGVQGAFERTQSGRTYCCRRTGRQPGFVRRARSAYDRRHWSRICAIDTQYEFDRRGHTHRQ